MALSRMTKPGSSLLPLFQSEHLRPNTRKTNEVGPSLYVAFTNASAFSPTDAMPLTVRIKT